MTMFPDAILSRAKRPSEEFRLGWDFVDDIEAGDTLLAQEVKCLKASDGSDVTATMIESPSLDGTTVLAQVQGGTAGETYHVRFQATSTAGDKWQRVVSLRVRD
jgi:hypothetical protein